MPKVHPVTRDDSTEISSLARTIWFRQYRTMLSNAQINYMLAQRYCPVVITAQLDDMGVWWRKLVFDAQIIGFSCYLRVAQSAELKIDKLYIQHDYHRRGYGRILVDDALCIMSEQMCNRLILTVNKQNRTAIHAYRRYGFTIEGNSIVDIGGGFVMNDYLMALTG